MFNYINLIQNFIYRNIYKMSKIEDVKFYSKTKVQKKNNFNGLNPNMLKNVRIVQKHLVYVIGLSSSLANKEVIEI